MGTAVSVLLFFGGCKKSNPVNGTVRTVVEAYTANGQTTNTTTNYTYDNQGRQVLAAPTVGNSTVTVYGSGSVTQTTGTTVVTYQLNAQGLAISDNTGATYTYDNNGFLLSETSGPNNSQSNTISNGDISNSTIVVNGVTTNLTYSYTTNTDYKNTGISFLGKNSTHLISSVLYSQGSATVTYTFTYAFDNQGRVLQMTITGNNTTDQFSYTYTS